MDRVLNADKAFLVRFQDDFLRIEQELKRTFSSRVPLIKDMGHHSLLSKGKRLRPLLFILSCRLFDHHAPNVYRLATIFEYIHTASLLHDDVLDNAEVRRRRPSANRVWGNHAAVLEGDFLYSKSFSIALEARTLDFLERLTRTTTQMAEGQILELAHTDNWDIEKEQYMEIITSKTAILISSACACGAIVSGAEDWAVEQLAGFGLNMGIAFQLMDDLFDYISTEEELGKPVGKDLREGKITLPLIYTLAEVGSRSSKTLEEVFTSGRARDEDYRKLIHLVRKNGAIERIRAEARGYVEKAADSLLPFPPCAGKDDLLDLNSYIVHRRY